MCVHTYTYIYGWHACIRPNSPSLRASVCVSRACDGCAHIYATCVRTYKRMDNHASPQEKQMLQRYQMHGATV